MALINRDPKQRSHFREGRGRKLPSLCLQSLGKGSKSRVGGVFITQFEGWQTENQLRSHYRDVGELKAVAGNCRGRRWRPPVFELREIREDERKQNSDP